MNVHIMIMFPVIDPQWDKREAFERTRIPVIWDLKIVRTI